MDYEKVYKDTINKLQQMVNSGKITVEIARGIYADFVPESEDERIRKEIICFLRNIPNSNYTCEEMAAWLEAQGEQKPVEWSDDDKQYLLICKNALRKYQTTDKWDAEIISHWLENKLKAHQTYWNPSEEQLISLSEAINDYEKRGIFASTLRGLFEQLKKL